MILNRIRNYMGLVRFAHTVFAMPFALMGALVAARGLPEIDVCGWILFCMVAARTSAMTFNRIVDRHIDRRNPRTQFRHLPAGTVSVAEAVGLWIVSSMLFVFGAWRLNELTFLLSPVALLLICGYSYFKRFSSMSHFMLGQALAIAPIGAWIAVTGTWSWPPFVLGAAVMAWVSGFDIIYALMDEEFDRLAGLHSLVVSFGREKALRIAFALHLLSVILMGLFGWIAGLSWIFAFGTLGYAAMILYEHSIVHPDDVSRVNTAFFNVNGIISIGLFVCTLADVFLLG